MTILEAAYRDLISASRQLMPESNHQQPTIFGIRPLTETRQQRDDDMEKCNDGNARKEVADAARAAGFVPYHTGGGVMVWRRDEGDTYLMFSNQDGGLDGNPDDRKWDIGRYSDHHEGFIEIAEGDEDHTLADVLALAEKFPPLTDEGQHVLKSIDANSSPCP